MRVIVLYHKNDESEGVVSDFATEFARYKNRQLELISLESREGEHLAILYGIDRYPAILAVSQNGSLQQLWQGLPLPLMNELSYYTQDNEPTLGHEGHPVKPLKTSA